MDIGTKESLFQPGQPVSADRFKGREEIIKEILKYFPSVKSGNHHHFFITGKRGMGTLLASETGLTRLKATRIFATYVHYLLFKWGSA